MRNKVLIIVDMQNDFISGSLANPAAEAIVEPLCYYIKQFKGSIICTRDTHDMNYLNTPEGKKLPVEHCIKDTAGWCVDARIQKALRDRDVCFVNKPTFGSLEWLNGYNSHLGKCDIYLCGTCTDICVVSNALILKAAYPTAIIYVLPDLCAGLTKEKHLAAINVMNSCQIESVFTSSLPEPLDIIE